MKVKKFWNERWAPVNTPKPTKNSGYMISDFGRIISFNKETGKERLLNGGISEYNFKHLSIHLFDNSSFRVYIHIFIARTWIEKKSEDQIFVVHKDQDKSNNNVNNLKWVTRKQLVEIQKANGRYDDENIKTGKQVKMTESKVRLLKKRLAKGKTKRKILAKQFGISLMQVSRISKGENWGHVKIK